MQGNRDHNAAGLGGTLADRRTAELVAAVVGGTAGGRSLGDSSEGARGCAAAAGRVAGHAQGATAAGAVAVSDNSAGEHEGPDKGLGSAVRTARAAGCIRMPELELELEQAGDILLRGRDLHGLVLRRVHLSGGVPAGTVGRRQHSQLGHLSALPGEGPGEAARSCMPSVRLVLSAL